MTTVIAKKRIFGEDVAKADVPTTESTMITIINESSIIGKGVPKPDAPDKAIGRTRYINDLQLPLMLVGKILHTDRVHARIKNIDVTAAKSLPGVHTVLTGEDIPELRFGCRRDNVPLKRGKVRCTRARTRLEDLRTPPLSGVAPAWRSPRCRRRPQQFHPGCSAPCRA